jgi:hypothetical protein
MRSVVPELLLPERPLALAPHRRVHREPELVDEAGREEIPRQLAAAVRDQVSVALRLQLRPQREQGPRLLRW